MSLELFLSSIFQVATGLVLATWAIVGVAVSTYYAYKVAQNLITRRARVIGKLKKSKLFSLYENKGGNHGTPEKQSQRANNRGVSKADEALWPR